MSLSSPRQGKRRRECKRKGALALGLGNREDGRPPARLALQRIDVLIAASLVVAVAGSAWGVLTWEGDATLFEVEWAASELELAPSRATHAGAGEAELSFDVTERNLTSARVVVTVTGGAPRVQPTDVLVQLSVPGLNETLQQEAQLPVGAEQSVDVAFDVPLGGVPEVESVRATSAEAALAQLPPGGGVGVGNWTVMVSFAPGAPGPLGNEAHSVTVQLTLETYEARVDPAIGEVGR